MEWQLGEVRYRRWRAFRSMCWPLQDLSKVWIVGARCGGPLAVIDRQGGSTVTIYSSSGRLLSTCVLDDGRGGVAGLGWNENGLLVFVTEDGRVLAYDTFGEVVSRTRFDSDRGGSVLESAAVSGRAAVAMSSSKILFVCEFFADGTTETWSVETGLVSPPSSMACLSAEHNNNATAPQSTESAINQRGRGVEVALGTRDGSIAVADRNGCEDQLLHLSGAVLDMAVAPNGRFVACFTSSGNVSVLSTTFTTKVLEFDTSTSARPTQMAWCGEDSVVLYWQHRKFLLMIGPYGHWLKLPYGGGGGHQEQQHDVNLVAERDGCRVLTARYSDFLQRVPDSIETIHRIGSTDLAAMLYDAMEAFRDGDPKADENMRVLSTTTSAVTTCVSAAVNEFDPVKQKKYLAAAAYGKHFCSSSSPLGHDFATSYFVDSCRVLRVLNHLRQADPGIPISYAQYESLSASGLVRRLASLRLFALSARVAEHLAVRHEDVAAAWLCQGIKKRLSTSGTSSSTSPSDSDDGDAAVRDWIRHVSSRLSFSPSSAGGGVPVPSAQRLAAVAGFHKRKRLATMLIDEYEVDVAVQVKLLLGMGEPEVALQKALNSLEMDSVYLVALRSSSSSPVLEQQIYRHQPEKYSSKLLPGKRDFAVGYSYAQSSLAARIDQLKGAVRSSSNLSSSSSSDASAATEVKYFEDQIHLLETQVELEKKFKVSCFVDMSLAETVYNLTALAATQPDSANSLFSEAYQIHRRFKMSERHFYFVKIRALAASSQLSALRAFSDEKKPPVGFLPFVQALLENKHDPAECEVYVSRLASLEDRFENYASLGLWKQAAETAYRLRDRAKLLQLQSMSGQDERIVALVTQLSSRL